MLPAGSPCDKCRSRTVPTNATTPPTPASPARRAATSALRSKSSVRTVTRGVCIVVPSALPSSTSGHRRKERQLAACRRQRRLLVAQHLVERHAQRLAACKRGGMGAASGDQRIAHARHRRAVVDLERFTRSERFADRREIPYLQLHRPSHSANER